MPPLQVFANYKHRQNLLVSLKNTALYRHQDSFQQAKGFIEICWNTPNAYAPRAYKDLVQLVKSRNPITLEQLLDVYEDVLEATVHARKALLALKRVRLCKSQRMVTHNETKKVWNDWGNSFDMLLREAPPESPVLNSSPSLEDCSYLSLESNETLDAIPPGFFDE